MRLLASDVDGTLLPRLGEMTDRTVAALRSAQDAGVHVVLASGRPPRWMTTIAARTGLVGHAVLANGAVVVDLQRVADPDQGILRTHTIDPDDAWRLAVELRAALPDIHFAVESLVGFGVEPGWPQAVEADLPRASLDQLLARGAGVIKLLAKSADSGDPFEPADPEDPAEHAGSGAGDEMLSVARRIVGDRGEATHSGSRTPLVEIGPPGVDKATALAELTADFGVARADTVAFGDMPNDVAMLRWAGTGYAMADGHVDALAAADLVAPPSHEDGVAQVVEGLLVGLSPRANA